MTNCLALTLIVDAAALDHAEALAQRFARVITDPAETDLQNGDLVLVTEEPDWTWIASNVILLPDGRAPIVRRVALVDAVAG